jgi:hypothetical protein
MVHCKCFVDSSIPSLSHYPCMHLVESFGHSRHLWSSKRRQRRSAAERSASDLGYASFTSYIPMITFTLVRCVRSILHPLHRGTPLTRPQTRGAKGQAPSVCRWLRRSTGLSVRGYNSARIRKKGDGTLGSLLSKRPTRMPSWNTCS